MKNRTTPPKVFIIGHNKCGTRSICELFKIDGYTSLHWEKNHIANTIRKNFYLFKPLLSGLRKVNVYSDMESLAGPTASTGHPFYAYRLYPLLDLQYPNSLFIYNYRDKSHWIRSRLKHADGKYLGACRRQLRALHCSDHEVSTDDVVEWWERSWESYQEEVFSYFANKSNFFAYNIDANDSFNSLKCFLIDSGYDVSSDCLPVVGRNKKLVKLSNASMENWHGANQLVSQISEVNLYAHISNCQVEITTSPNKNITIKNIESKTSLKITQALEIKKSFFNAYSSIDKFSSAAVLCVDKFTGGNMYHVVYCHLFRWWQFENDQKFDQLDKKQYIFCDNTWPWAKFIIQDIMNIDALFLAPSKIYQLDHLILPWSCIESSQAPLLGCKSHLSFSFLHEIRAKLFKYLHNNKQSKRRRIYISRQMSRRRAIDGEEKLIEFLRSLGFEILTLETMTPDEQLLAFCESDYIVSPHGAGLSNIIACASSANIYEIHCEGGMQCYRRLAILLGLNYIQFNVLCPITKSLNGNMSLDCEVLLPALLNHFKS